ncbi:MAG: hypothetical protein DIU71_18685 [Proteobacteria bacterium]|nr:MAG: hypothetical protein DIU71_18685 [Pseudomonadota bacterium]
MHTAPAAGRAEHISLEAAPDVLATPAAPVRRKARATFTLASTLRGCATELSLLEDHYLGVRRIRGPQRTDYVFDLRFAHHQPVIVRRIAWGWLAITLTLLAAATVGFVGALSDTQVLWRSHGFFVGLAALLGTPGAALLCLRRTTESLQFVSAHGRAPLVSVTGGIGAGRTGQAFFVEVIKSIGAARHARPQSRQAFLRDEMREHHRLHQAGALSDEEYEAGKKRILQAHD